MKEYEKLALIGNMAGQLSNLLIEDKELNIDDVLEMVKHLAIRKIKKLKN